MGYGVSDAVSETLDTMNYLKTALKRDLVNYSALSRDIKPLVEEKLGSTVSMDAIIIAIRRYANTLRESRGDTDLINVLSLCSLIVRTGMVNVHFKRNASLFGKLTALYSKVNWVAGERMYIIQRSDEVSVIANSKFMPFFNELISQEPETLINLRPNLALVTVNFPPVALDFPGLFSFMMSQLADGRVNVNSIFSTYSGVTFTVAESDAARAYERLNNAIYEAKSLYAQRLGVDKLPEPAYIRED